jgi:hypothetical protein
VSCGIEDETVRHLIFDCPTYKNTRHWLRAELGHRKVGNIRFLLRNWAAKGMLMHYLDVTGRWTAMLGMLAVPPYIPQAPVCLA